ncbi:hypothetical protein CFN78_15995 [Amycolatopsis antarctica]|uniref:Uncharacterized protein n=1 Tax=Amycolatopsis antarctica TaxID=1854586 RepID=A0A263D516_9PSEU|nr:hypothetical protein [Amycolatopsis antarctica]OZM72475.1 hypothetical protein CFN78_15995 [Amycolatopsis antarctica]
MTAPEAVTSAARFGGPVLVGDRPPGGETAAVAYAVLTGFGFAVIGGAPWKGPAPAIRVAADSPVGELAAAGTHAPTS